MRVTTSMTGTVGNVIRALLLITCMLAASAGCARGASDIALDALPAEARHTLDLIRSNGPFPYDRDGVVFGNREQALPAQARGYYHEYTVKMPGARGRGAHRIVCGGYQRAARDCYYSDDHYTTFRRIR